jgi:tetratricopeptide (TPR) repeat protein
MDTAIPSLKTIGFAVMITALGIFIGGCAVVKPYNLEKEGIEAFNASDYATALEKWQAGLERARDLDDKRYTGQFLYNIGLAYDKLNQYQEALDSYQQALGIYREEDDKHREANTLNNIGVVYAKLSQYQDALDTYRQALIIRRTSEDKQGEGNTLDNIGSVYYRLGQYQQALDAYQQALVIRRAIEVEDKQGEGNTLNNIGIVYESQGQYQQALEFYQQALDVRRSIVDKSGEGITLNNIGVVYWRLGQYQQALDYYQQALAIKREIKDKPGEANNLNNIGVVHWKLGQYRDALDAYRQTLTIRQAVGDKCGEGSTLNNIGKVYESQHHDQQALGYYQQALIIRCDIGDKRGEGTTLNNIGGTYLKLGQYQQAYEAFQTSDNINATLGTRDGLWMAQHGLAAVEVQLNQPESAITHYEQALDTIEALRAGLTEKEYKLSFIQDKLYVYDELIDLLQTLHQVHPDRGYDRKALEIFERKQGRVFLEEIGKSGARLFAGLPEAIAQKERDLENQLEQVRDQLAEKRTKLIAEQNKKLLQSLEERENTLVTEQTALQKQIKIEYPDYYALRYPQPVALAELQRHVLQPGELMLVYGVMQNKTCLWLVGQEEFGLYSIDIGEETLAAKVDELREALQREYEWGMTRSIYVINADDSQLDQTARTQKTSAQASHELYTVLFPEKVRPLLNDQHTLNIVPTGPLYALPFEALVTENPPLAPPERGRTPPYAPLKGGIVHYLIKELPISYLSSASLLKILREAQARHPSTDSGRTKKPQYPLLAFAHPAYESTPTPSQEGKRGISLHVLQEQFYREFCGGNYQELPETAEEVKTIADLLHAPDESDPLQLREKASKANVFVFNQEKRLDDYQYLVFAMHGMLPGDMDDLNQPALVLSDDFLKMAHVFGLQLNAKLVSLSACNTGRGTQVKGEGVMGLTRAFMYAGTPTVAVTLWSVDSLSAKDLDIGFFRHLNDELPPAKALQAIKKQMLHGDVGKQYQHPYYWAPFVVFGDGSGQ